MNFVAYTNNIVYELYNINSEFILREICNGNVEWTWSVFEEQKFLVKNLLRQLFKNKSAISR